ncbi:MAG: RDD family protein [Verrucomicrobia bacterium]|nr:RDD family protein [Verrucomicrobiota bacterium]
MISRQKHLLIRTPEGIVFPLILASPVSRMLAVAIDTVCVIAIGFVIRMILSGFSIVSLDIAGAFSLIAGFLLSVGYPMFFEWLWHGQTIGKKAVRIQVMDEQGLRLRFHQVMMRNLLRVVDTLPWFYMLGGIVSVLSPRSQRLGDMAANTIVVHHPKVQEPDLDQILPGKFNSFRNYPHLVARLRQHATPAEAGIALSALVRRDDLDDDARLTVFSELKAQMEKHVKFPPEVTEGLSDEQYIRNIVEVLFRQ